MEALGDIGTRHSSFDEIDQILTIVEKSKDDYEITRERQIRAVLVGSVFLLTAFIMLTLFRTFLAIDGLLPTYIVAAVYVAVWIYFVTHSYRRVAVKGKAYKRDLHQAIETVREVVPVLSQKENWSTLEKIRIRLRLSKLSISPAELLE